MQPQSKFYSISSLQITGILLRLYIQMYAIIHFSQLVVHYKIVLYASWNYWTYSCHVSLGDIKIGIVTHYYSQCTISS
jgi:hypothetical protein